MYIIIPLSLSAGTYFIRRRVARLEIGVIHHPGNAPLSGLHKKGKIYCNSIELNPLCCDLALFFARRHSGGFLAE